MIKLIKCIQVIIKSSNNYLSIIFSLILILVLFSPKDPTINDRESTPISKLSSTFKEDYHSSATNSKAIVFRNISPHINTEEFNLPGINNLVELFKSEGLLTFDPIRMLVTLWISKLEILILKHNVLNYSLLIIPSFLEKVSRSYFNYLKSTERNFDFNKFKERFICKFRSFRILKINEAMDYKLKDQMGLVDYVKKKKDLIKYVFPEMCTIDVLNLVIAGMEDKRLIDIFSAEIYHDYESFIDQVKVFDAFNTVPEESDDDEVSSINILETVEDSEKDKRMDEHHAESKKRRWTDTFFFWRE